jgi:hypothetical protein
MILHKIVESDAVRCSLLMNTTREPVSVAGRCWAVRGLAMQYLICWAVRGLAMQYLIIPHGAREKEDVWQDDAFIR